jgi:hypothetical protein
MQAYKAYYRRGRVVPVGEPVIAEGSELIITVLGSNAESEAAENTNYRCNIGFLKDKVPELPDSFFDPLPEEDLQAWGL